jgi:hypothetical protein
VSRASAIAAVSATLRARLANVLNVAGLNAGVSHKRPGTTGAFTTPAGVHLFLYMVTPHAAMRNNDLPTRDASGKLMQRPTAALDLHYLLSFVATDTDLEAQLMLGAVTVDLHANPTLGVNEIKAATLGTPFEQSQLAQQIERVRLVGEAINLEEFSKLWSVFFQTQYLLSVAYKASVVLLEAEVDTPVPAPVRSRDIWSTPLPPTIDTVAPAMIGMGGRLRLHGRGFLSDHTFVRFPQTDGDPLEVDPVLLLDDRLEVDLPANLIVGLTPLAVVTSHEATSGDSTRTFELESSEVAFTLVPQLVDSASEPIVAISGVPDGDIEF